MSKKYQIIYADPPWKYHNKQFDPKGWSGGVPYSDMTLDELKELGVQDIADPNGSLCFMWASSPLLKDAIEVLECWGFKYITIGFIWDKQRVNPGHYTMSECEICIIGKMKRIPQPRGARNIRQLVSVKRSAHSEKPGVIRERITQMFPRQNKIELFARKPFIPTKAKGVQWDVWGNEVVSNINRQRKLKAMSEGVIIPQKYPYTISNLIKSLKGMRNRRSER